MSLKEKINLVKQQLEINEIDTMALEKSIGKKLVDYDSIDALVAALMGYYNPLIKGISETFKNFCPFKVGDIYLTTNSTNPSSTFLGTTWQKIEGRFLLGTSGSGASKATGGSNSKTIAQANLPNVKLAVNTITGSISVSRFSSFKSQLSGGYNGEKTISIPESGTSAIISSGGNGGNIWLNSYYTTVSESKSFSLNPQTSALGSGSALDVTPAYYTVHMWLRLT